MATSSSRLSELSRAVRSSTPSQPSLRLAVSASEPTVQPGAQVTGPRCPRPPGGPVVAGWRSAALPRHPGIAQNGQADRHAVLAEEALLAVRAIALALRSGAGGRLGHGQNDQVVRGSAHGGDDLIADGLHAGNGIQVPGPALERPLAGRRAQGGLGNGGPRRSCHAAIQQQRADIFENGREATAGERLSSTVLTARR